MSSLNIIVPFYNMLFVLKDSRVMQTMGGERGTRERRETKEIQGFTAKNMHDNPRLYQQARETFSNQKILIHTVMFKPFQKTLWFGDYINAQLHPKKSLIIIKAKFKIQK